METSVKYILRVERFFGKGAHRSSYYICNCSLRLRTEYLKFWLVILKSNTWYQVFNFFKNIQKCWRYNVLNFQMRFSQNYDFPNTPFYQKMLHFCGLFGNGDSLPIKFYPAENRLRFILATVDQNSVDCRFYWILLVDTVYSGKSSIWV